MPRAGANESRDTSCSTVVLAQRLADQQHLAVGWSAESATDTLRALIRTEMLERLLTDRRWPN